MQAPGEDLVNDAVTVVWIVGFLAIVVDSVSFAVPMQYIQCCNEELMGILLLVACEVTCMSPHQVQQPEWNVGRTVARVELLKKLRHLTHQTGV